MNCPNSHLAKKHKILPIHSVGICIVMAKLLIFELIGSKLAKMTMNPKINKIPKSTKISNRTKIPKKAKMALKTSQFQKGPNVTKIDKK